MWDEDSLLGKARAYFARAQQHPGADDEILALWLLLGLEFLLRAPLARVSPYLLADPTGDSVMHVAGYGRPGGRPMSIQTKTVIERLGRIIDTFTKDRQDEAKFLVGLRNSEVHTGEVALAIDTALWLPPFMRVVDVLCTHLGEDPTDLLGSDIVNHARALVDAEDQKIAHAVREGIAACKAAFEALPPEEVEARRSRLPLPIRPMWSHLGVEPAPVPTGPPFVNCPACSSRITMSEEAVRTTREWIDEDDEIHRDVIYVAKSLSCPVCGLELANTAEISSAGLPQQWTRTVTESVRDRFLDSYEPDYGND